MNITAQNNQQHTENVVKFLLKLRNNTMQNLKNALRKLAEKTQGNKDQLLLRLAQKLATEDGRTMVKQFFKPEIYHELYEVDVYSNGNKNNSVYQYYRNMIPQNMTCPASGTVGQGPMTNGNGQNQMKPNDLMQQHQNPIPQNPNNALANQIANKHQQNQQQNQGTGQVIDIDDDDDCVPNNVQQQQYAAPDIGGNQEANIIPSEMAPIGEPNVPLDASITRDMSTNVKIDLIHNSTNYPCVLDDNQLAGQSPIYCHCDSYNSEFHRGTNQRQCQKLIQCHTCKRSVHMDCQEDNRRMKQSKIGITQEFNCHHCQFMALDPLAIPVATILRPYKISKLRQEQASQRMAHMKKTMKEFIIKEQYFQNINTRRPGKSTMRIQVRSIRLDGIGFEHCFPKFGFMQVNDQRNQTEFKIPDPPNHEKKRKDEIMDITSISLQGRNLINMFQTQKDHKGFFNHPGHIVAIFLVKILQPHDIVNFITTQRTEQGANSLRRYQDFFGGQNRNDEVAEMENQETEQVTINLADSITMLPISVPARGEICTHLQCFDLETYIQMNSKHKRWLCPFCNKRSSHVMIDPFFSHILDIMKELRDKVYDIDDKINMQKDLSILFTKDKGKFQGKYLPNLVDGQVTGYVLQGATPQIAAPSPAVAAQEQKDPVQGQEAQQNGASTEASNGQPSPQGSQPGNSNSQGVLGKRVSPDGQADQNPIANEPADQAQLEEPDSKKQRTDNAPIELD